MNTNPDTARTDPLDPDWCSCLRMQLEHEANALDAVTAARLSAVRHRALAVAGDRATTPWLPWLGSAVAATLLLAVLVGREPPTSAARLSAVQPPPAGAQQDGALRPAVTTLLASDVAVIADLEFYDWLEEQDALL